jgi:small conductance mechanosensitive channel
MQETIVELLKELGVTEIPAWADLLIWSLNIIIILLLAFVVRTLVGRLLTSVHARLTQRARGTEEKKRIDTIDRMLRYITSVVITVVTIMVVLSELGISIAPFLATAGVVGIAVSFGAQSLVKDYFTGFVMLLENQIRQGDFIEVAQRSGTVEEVTLRHVRLRDGEGVVHFVPNSSITIVSNFSREFAYSVVDINVAYQTHLGQAYDAIKSVGGELRADPSVASKLLEDLEILGVTALGDSSMVLRIRVKVRALEQWGVKRLLLAKLKHAFEQAGIEIPLPQRVLHINQTDASTTHR